MTDGRTLTLQRIEVGPWGQNCYVASSETGDAVVIDPGGDAERILDHVAAETLRIHAVLATHGHHDHVGAVAELTAVHRVPFGIHSADAPALRRVNLCRSVFHGLGPVDIPSIDIDLAESAMLGFNGLEIAPIHTPGHTPGSVCLDMCGALITGDTLMASGAGSTAMREADPDRLRTSIRRLARAYRAETAIHPGHGEPGRLGDAVGAFEGMARSA